jgi:RNA polymerase sigma-70 factor (sigma-E family)
MDDDGFRDFVQARMVRLSRVAYLLTGDHHAAEDLLQSALIKLASRWPQVRRDGGADAYLRKIIYHEHVSIWRRAAHLRAERSGAELPDRAGSRDEAETAVQRLVIERALARLTPRQRAVIVLRFFEDLSEADTARVMSCSVGTVKSQTSHALQRLRVLAPELRTFTADTEEVMA